MAKHQEPDKLPVELRYESARTYVLGDEWRGGSRSFALFVVAVVGGIARLVQFVLRRR